MAKLYLDILVIICIGLILWGIIRTERIYQYPFFMGGIIISFILTQAFALIDNPGQVSPEALERVLLMSCLCTAACWFGYERKVNHQWLNKFNIALDERKLFQAGVILTAQTWFFNFLLSRTTIQIASNSNWTGPATIYVFFMQAGNIAFGIFLLQTLKRFNFINLICTIISGWPLLSVVLLGRRQPTMTFIIIVGLSVFLIRRWIPPRWFVANAMLMLVFLIPLFGHIRGGFWNLVFSGNWQEILTLSQEAFSSQQKGELLELRNAALVMDAVEKTGLYGLGSGWWDSIIFQFVPGQIVGFDFKKSLQFNNWDKYLELLQSLYGYSNPSGLTFTGVADAFVELSYFGFIAFACIGYLFKHIWISAVYHKSTFASLLYMGLVSPAMVCVTHGVGRFWQEGIFQFLFIGLVAYYSRQKSNYSFSMRSF